MKTPEESYHDEDNKSSLEEQAINKEKTQGKKINHQVQDKREHHEPRDNIKN